MSNERRLLKLRAIRIIGTADDIFFKWIDRPDNQLLA
jgi:hypothetical protein